MVDSPHFSLCEITERKKITWFRGVCHEHLFLKAMRKNLLPIILSIFSFNAIFAQSEETFTVTLDHNKGVGDPEQITVVYNQPMPENIGLVAPTRKGYEFTGYSRNGIYYYDADMKSV